MAQINPGARELMLAAGGEGNGKPVALKKENLSLFFKYL